MQGVMVVVVRRRVSANDCGEESKTQRSKGGGEGASLKAKPGAEMDDRAAKRLQLALRVSRPSLRALRALRALRGSIDCANERREGSGGLPAAPCCKG